MPRPPNDEVRSKTASGGLPFSSLSKGNRSSAVDMVSDPGFCSPDGPSDAAPGLLISFILATHNRARVLLHTLERIAACGLAPREYEILIVDNCSTDGTAELIRRHVSGARLIVLERNRGSCAKGLAVPHARGEFVVFLDDDSYPLAGSIRNMVRHFEQDSSLGAAGFVVRLPNGMRECSALPSVFVGCGVGFRRTVLNAVGGLDVSYFMQAEEYDLSFRLIQAGFSVRTFDDLHVMHLKSPAARSGRQKVLYDARNNLTLAATYLPAPWHREYLRDWRQRYGWLARLADADREFQDGSVLGLARGYYRRWTRPQSRLRDETTRHIFGIDMIESAMARLAAQPCARILLADLGKNIFPYYRAATMSGLQIVAIMDDRFAGDDRRYRGIPIVNRARGLGLGANAIVVSNSSPIHARITELELRAKTDLPVYRWHGRFDFEPPGDLTLEHQASRMGATSAITA